MAESKYHRMTAYAVKCHVFSLFLLLFPLSFPALTDESSDCNSPGDVTTEDVVVAFSRCLLRNERSLETVHYLEDRVAAYQSTEMYALLGDAYNQLRRWRSAQENFQKAHELDPDDLMVAQGLLHVLGNRVMAISPKQVHARKATLPEACWYQEEKLPPAEAARITNRLIHQAMDLADSVAGRTSDVSQRADVLMIKAMLLFEEDRDTEAYALEEAIVDRLQQEWGSSGNDELQDVASMILFNMANQHAASENEELAVEYAERALLSAREEKKSEMEFLTRHLLENNTEKVNLMDVLVASGCDTITQPGP